MLEKLIFPFLKVDFTTGMVTRQIYLNPFRTDFDFDSSFLIGIGAAGILGNSGLGMGHEKLSP